MQSDIASVARHYFDWAAAALPDTDAPGGVSVPFGNPSSRHREGREAREALESARRRCAAVLGVKPETLYFTSGGTEANCIALYSNLPRPAGRIIASRAEHPSITANMETLARLGKSTGIIPVDGTGGVSAELLEKTLAKYGDIRFAAIMAVNNETGRVSDLPALREAADRQGAPVHLHCDMVQAAGKIPVDFSLCDSAALSAHKLGGPRGIGLLYLRRGTEVLYAGGGQERNVRPGTENTAGALAMAACLEKHAAPETVRAEYQNAARRMERLMDALAAGGRCAFIPAPRGAAQSGAFSPYILQAAFRGIPGEVMVRTLDDAGVAVSTGSACSAKTRARPVLDAMGIDEKTSLEGIRVSQGWSTTEADIDFLINAIAEALKLV